MLSYPIAANSFGPHIKSMESYSDLFAQSSLLWGLGLCLIIAALFYLRVYLSYRTIKQEAPTDFAYKRREKMIASTVSEDAYIRAYTRYHAPRASLHVAGVMSAIAILTLPALGLFYAVTFALWEMNGKDKVFAPGLIVHSLLMYFLIIFFWAAIAFLAARHYHGNAPISLEDELEKGNF